MLITSHLIVILVLMPKSTILCLNENKTFMIDVHLQCEFDYSFHKHFNPPTSKSHRSHSFGKLREVEFKT